MIKIISGWSNPGGSTESFIKLCNLFNDNNLECVYYGPHNYHLDKCKSDHLSNVTFKEDDKLIVHFLELRERPNVSKCILSVHEQNVFELKEKNLESFDIIQYVSKHQQDYHCVEKESVIIPNVMDKLTYTNKTKSKVAGIIGSIDSNKQTHISLLKALRLGFKRIYIYGNITDLFYYNTLVEPIIDKNRDKIVGPKFENDKQKMYDSISDLFFSSKMECLPYVIGESRMTNTKLHTLDGVNYLNGSYEFDDNKILEQWKNIL